MYMYIYIHISTINHIFQSIPDGSRCFNLLPVQEQLAITSAKKEAFRAQAGPISSRCFFRPRFWGTGKWRELKITLKWFICIINIDNIYIYIETWASETFELIFHDFPVYLDIFQPVGWLRSGLSRIFQAVDCRLGWEDTNWNVSAPRLFGGTPSHSTSLDDLLYCAWQHGPLPDFWLVFFGCLKMGQGPMWEEEFISTLISTMGFWNR